MSEKEAEEMAEAWLNERYLKDMGVRNPCKKAFLAGLEYNNKQLIKAKEIIKYLCGMVRELNKPNVQLTDVDYSLSEAEQFLNSEVEQ